MKYTPDFDFDSLPILDADPSGISPSTEAAPMPGADGQVALAQNASTPDFDFDSLPVLEEPVAQVQTMSPKDFKGQPNMGGATEQALMAQAQGGPVAEKDDGSISSWLKNAWNAFAHNASGRIASSDINWKTQRVMEGVAEKEGGKRVSFIDLPDAELDDYMNSIAPNGFWGYVGNAIGMGGRNDLMKEWDETQGAKIADPAERKKARVQYAMDVAKGVFQQTEEQKQFAQAELQGRGRQWQSDITGGAIQMAGYMAPALAPVVGMPLSAAVEGTARRNELLSDKYETDAEGNVYKVAQGDTRGSALVRGAIGGTVQAAVENYAGKVAGKIIGKIPGVAKAGDKVMSTAIGKAVMKYYRPFGKFFEKTGLDDAPSEFLEEFAQTAIDSTFGLDRRQSEMPDGMVSLERGLDATVDLVKNSGNLLESMLLVQLAGGGLAHMKNRLDANRILRDVVKVDPKKIKGYSTETKWRLIDNHFNGMSEEQKVKVLEAGAKEADNLLHTIEKERLDSFEGRLQTVQAHKDAAKRIYEAREQGKDVSRRMLQEMGVDTELYPTVAERNALADQFLEDRTTYKMRQEAEAAIRRTKMDEVQRGALADEITALGIDAESKEYGGIWLNVANQISDAKELDDPVRRAELVQNALEKYVKENGELNVQFTTDDGATHERSWTYNPPKKETTNETRTDETLPPTEQGAVGTQPSEGQEARPEAVGAQSAEADGVVKTSPKNAAEAKEYFTANVGKRFSDELGRTVELAGLSEDGKQVHLKVTFEDGSIEDIDMPVKAAGANIFSKNQKWKPIAETPIEAPTSAPSAEGAIAQPKATEGAEGGISQSDGAITPEEAAKERKKGKRIPKTAVKTEGAAPVAPTAVKPTKPVKANPKKAAAIVKDFAAKDDTRVTLKRIHHDHDSGLAVATDGRVLIATKHGYDSNYEDNPDAPYPNWKGVIPNYDKGTVTFKGKKEPIESIEIDPESVAKVCATAKRIARGIGVKDRVHVSIPLANGVRILMDADYMQKVAKAMSANGITEIKVPSKTAAPILAKNADTTIAAMPISYGGGVWVKAERGRGIDDSVEFDATTGKVLYAPNRKSDEKYAKTEAEIDSLMDNGTESSARPEASAPAVAPTTATPTSAKEGSGAQSPSVAPKAKEKSTKRTKAPKAPKLTEDLKKRGIQAARILGVESGMDVPELEKTLKQVSKLDSPAAKRKAQALRDLIEYRKAVGQNTDPQNEESSGGKWRGESMKSLGSFGSPDVKSPLKGGVKKELNADLSNEDNAKSFRKWMSELPKTKSPEWLSDGSPKAVFEWFERNMVGKTFSFDIPGYGHREFKVAPGHIGKLVCSGAKKGVITKPLSKSWMEAVRNGEVAAKDVNGWDVKRARMLPRIPEILNSFDAVIHEYDNKHDVDVFIFVKKFDAKNGRPNTIVMKLVDDGQTIGPVSTHIKDITISWLKNKDLILTDEGEVYNRSADNSASRKPLVGDNAERNSPRSGNKVSHSTSKVNRDEKKSPSNPLGQIVPPEDGSVAQAIDKEIALGIPPSPAPGSATNASLDSDYEPESIGKGIKNPISRQEIVDEFKKLFKDSVAIRGKNTTKIGKQFSGHYEPNSGIIRTQDYTSVSLRTIPHEIGHHIDTQLKRLALARPASVKNELARLGVKLYGAKKPNGGYESEGFAEIIKYYLQGNEAGLKKEVPNAYDWLINKFGKADPDTMAKLDDLRDLIDRLQNQSGEDAVRAIRAKDLSAVEKLVMGAKKVGAAAKPTQEHWTNVGAFIDKAMKASGLDKLMDWHSAMESGDTAKMNEIIENDPRLKWELYTGRAGARAFQSLEGGLMDLSGTRRYTYGDLGVATPGHSADENIPTFKEIFQDFTAKEMDEFQNYAIARIAKEAYLDKDLVFGLTESEVAPVIAKHANNQKFRKALDQYTHYKHAVLHLLVDSGAMSQEQFDAIVAANPIYVKIARRRESVDFFRDKMLKSRGKAVNKRTGSGRQIEDIFAAGLVDDERIFKAAFQSDILRSLVELGKKGERAGGVKAGYTIGANWIHEVPNAQGAVKFTSEKLRKQIVDAMQKTAVATDKASAENLFDQIFDDGKDTLTIFKEKPSNGKNGVVSLYDQEGRLHTYELPENNAEGWAKGLWSFTDASAPNIIEKIFSMFAASTRSGATVLSPGFAWTNFVIDTLHASVMNEYGTFIPFVSSLRGVVDKAMNSKASQIYDNMALGMGTMLGRSSLPSAKKATKYIQSKNWFVRQWNKGVIKGIADMVGYSEDGTRIAAFKNARDYMLKHGASEKAANIIAGANAGDITINFLRGGETVKRINRIVPFFNAGVQGVVQSARAFGLADPKAWSRIQSRKGRAAMTMGKGIGGLMMLALLTELYNHLSDDEDEIKELKPHEKWNKLPIGNFRLPIPHVFGYLFMSLPRAVFYEVYHGDKGAVKECLGMFRKTFPWLSPRDIALLGPILEGAMNETWSGSPIVSPHVMENRESYDWYTPRTTTFSKALAKAFHTVFGNRKVASPAHIDAFLNGVTGNMYGNLLGLFDGDVGIDSSRPHTYPVLGRFFRSDATSSRLIDDFYSRRDELRRKNGSGKATDEELGKLKYANQVADELSDLRKQAESVRKDDSLSNKQKYDELEKIAKIMQNNARQFLKSK